MSSPILDFARFYLDGGAIMHVILLAALFSGGLGLVALLVRRRVFGWVALGVGLMTLGLGVLGWQNGVREVEEALTIVASDQRVRLREIGMTMAMIPLKFGAVCAAPGVLGGLLGVTLARGRR